MKNLRYGSRGPDVRKLQEFLKDKGYYIQVDRRGREHYGPGTKACVKWYQRNEGLKPDGKFGPASRRSMTHASMCKYQEAKFDKQTTVIRMNKFSTKAEVLNPKRMTIRQMFKLLVSKGKHPKVVINGSMFDTRDMSDSGHLKVNRVSYGKNFYDDDGLGIDDKGHCFISKDSDAFRDFMGFSPAVYLFGTINKEYKDLMSSFLTVKHPRTMLQINDEYINVFIIRGRSRWRRWYGANFNKVVTYCQVMASYDNTQKTSAGLYDGGGSTGAYTDRGYTLGWSSRSVANGIAFYVEGV